MRIAVSTTWLFVQVLAHLPLTPLIATLAQVLSSLAWTVTTATPARWLPASHLALL